MKVSAGLGVMQRHAILAVPAPHLTGIEVLIGRECRDTGSTKAAIL